MHALAAAFEAALETLSVAVVIVDAELHVHFANRAARALFETGALLVRRRDVLQATFPAADEALSSVVAEAARGNWPSPSNAIPLSDRDGRPAIAHVTPLRDNVSVSGFAAVFVTTPVHFPLPPFEALSALYDLTPTEARVLVEIASGKNRAASAAALGIADSTVKTHLARVFAKTRTSEQAELTMLAMSLTPPVITPTR